MSRLSALTSMRTELELAKEAYANRNFKYAIDTARMAIAIWDRHWKNSSSPEADTARDFYGQACLYLYKSIVSVTKGQLPRAVLYNFERMELVHVMKTRFNPDNPYLKRVLAINGAMSRKLANARDDKIHPTPVYGD